jgi:hypothetical protein
MFLLDLVSATLGVWFGAKALGDLVLVPIGGAGIVDWAILKPPYPLEIGIGILTGYISRIRWKGSQALWIWLPPTIYLAAGIILRVQLGFHLREAVVHFFRQDCYPLCDDQYERTVPLYTTIAYSLGALTYFRHQRFSANRQK